MRSFLQNLLPFCSPPLLLIFSGLAFWRLTRVPHDWLVSVLQFFSVFFLFYTINFWTLIIQLSSENLRLKFGLFNWTVPVDNISGCRLDPISGFMRYGGAGIHFMMVDKRYRASFNFLEDPRVVVAFKKKVGPVVEISFTTRQPDELIRLIHETAST